MRFPVAGSILLLTLERTLTPCVADCDHDCRRLDNGQGPTCLGVGWGTESTLPRRPNNAIG